MYNKGIARRLDGRLYMKYTLKEHLVALGLRSELMTSGEEGKQGFQPKISKENIKLSSKTLKNLLKNSQVLNELKKLDPKKYDDTSFNGVKRVLLEMWKAGEIGRGYDRDLRVYLWEKKQGLSNNETL